MARLVEYATSETLSRFPTSPAATVGSLPVLLGDDLWRLQGRLHAGRVPGRLGVFDGAPALRHAQAQGGTALLPIVPLVASQPRTL